MADEYGYTYDGLGIWPFSSSEETAAEKEASFLPNWKQIKSKILQLIALPGNISKLQDRAAALKGTARRYNAASEARELDAVVQWSFASSVVADKSRAKIEAHLPNWQRKAADVPPSGGLGFIPLLIGASAIGALAYVASKGMKALTEYTQQKRVVDLLEKKVISAREAQKMLGATKEQKLGVTETLIAGTTKTAMVTILPFLGLAIGVVIFVKIMKAQYVTPVTSKYKGAKEAYGNAKKTFGF